MENFPEYIQKTYSFKLGQVDLDSLTEAPPDKLEITQKKIARKYEMGKKILDVVST